MSLQAVFALGRSAALLATLALVDALADAPDPLLLEGEPGTGKTVLARFIHQRSGVQGDFIVRPIPAIPDSLQQSVLFGHARGAFTGATGDQRGLIESAQGGTLFLDELGEATPSVQASLLEVLESGTVTRLGEARSRPVSVRILAATNADLTERSRSGGFRRDLLDRFGPFRIPIPPLRERKDEIVQLFLGFLAEAASGAEGAIEVAWAVDAAVQTLLLSHPWPGNLRQLRKEARFAARLCRGQRIVRYEHLSPDLQADG
ncbi:MAG: sigma 54-interacting transcriptional regulator, partial [Gemmatimonadota bacterium]